MLYDLFTGLFVAMLPAAIGGFILYFVAMTTGLLPRAANGRELEQALKQINKEYKNEKNGKKKQRRSADNMIWYDDKPEKPNYILKKWMSFGGGFYGTMALVTYVGIEYQEIVEFLSNFTSIADFIARIGIGMLIDFIIESIINFFLALAWPFYWLTNGGGLWQLAIHVAMAYIGYRVGRHYALVAVNNQDREKRAKKKAAKPEEGPQPPLEADPAKD